MKNTASKLSHLITEARLIAGITQKELATRMGISQPSIARAERGLQEPSVSFLQRVAEAVGVELVLPTFRPKSYTHTEYLHIKIPSSPPTP